jgi:hypothetical protein
MKHTGDVSQPGKPKPRGTTSPAHPWRGKMKKSFLMVFIVVFALVLSACDRNKPAQQSGTVTAVNITSKPAELEINKGTIVGATVTGDKASQEVTWSSSNPAVATINDKGEITPLSAGTTTITATSKADPSKKDSFTLVVVTLITKPNPVVITSVELLKMDKTQYGSLQVRQSFGQVIMVARGTGLEKAANPRLIASDGTSLPGITLQDLSNNTSVFAILNVANGLPTGQYTLRVDVNDNPPAEKADAVEITPIVFSPSGNDSTGEGTFLKPFKVLDGPFYDVGVGDTLYLTDGDHDRATTFFIPDGVTLEGESAAAKLVAGGGMGGANGLEFDGNASLKTLTVDSFSTCLFANNTDAVSMTEVTVSNCTNNGLSMGDRAKVTTKDTVFTRNATDSIEVSGDSELSMTGGESSETGWTGLYVSGGSPKVTLDSVKIINNGQVGPLNSGIEYAPTGPDSSIVVRNTTISGNKGDGVNIYGRPVKVDFGTVGNAGNNVIKANGVGNTAYWQVHDLRAANQTTIIELVGTVLLDNTSLQGLMTCDGTAAKCEFKNGALQYWKVDNSGNSVRLTKP